MQTPRNAPRKGPKLLDMKVFITALAMAVTFGLWNLLSNNAVQADKAVPPAEVSNPPQNPSGVAQDLPPLPTLLPLAEMQVEQVSAAQNVAAAQAPSQSASLRVVDAPKDQVIVQKSKPIVGSVAQVGNTNTSSGGSGGSRSSGGSKPVATTKSSK
jgi:hypothetical protein